MNKSIKNNAILNVIRQGCGVVFPLITFPYISRVLGPESYGKYSFALSFINYFLLFAMLGVNTYAIREGARIRKNKKALEKFTSEITTINLCSTIISLIGLTILTITYNKLYDHKELVFVLGIIIPSTMIGRDWINNIFEDFFYITVRYIILQVLSIVAIFLFVRSSGDYIKYSIIYTMSITVGYIINLFYTQKYIPLKLTFKMNLKKHLKPICILFVGLLATMVYIQSDITMIGIIMSEYDVGIYTVASRIYTIVKSLMSALVNAVIPRIVFFLGEKNEKSYNELLNKLSAYLMTLVFPLMIGLILMSREILLLIGGEAYLGGVLTLEILGIALIFAVISGFYCNAILIPNRQEQSFLYITVISAVINVGLNFILIPICGIMGAAITTLISEIVVTVLSIKKGRKYSSIAFIKNDVVSVFLGTVAIILICFILKKLIESYLLCFFISVFLSSAGYFLILFFMKNRMVRELFKR